MTQQETDSRERGVTMNVEPFCGGVLHQTIVHQLGLVPVCVCVCVCVVGGCVGGGGGCKFTITVTVWYTENESKAKSQTFRNYLAPVYIQLQRSYSSACCLGIHC